MTSKRVERADVTMALDLNLTWCGRRSTSLKRLASTENMKVGAIDQSKPGASAVILSRNLVIKSRGRGQSPILTMFFL